MDLKNKKQSLYKCIKVVRKIVIVCKNHASLWKLYNRHFPPAVLVVNYLRLRFKQKLIHPPKRDTFFDQSLQLKEFKIRISG